MSWFTDKSNTRIQRSPSVEWRLIDEKAVLINVDDGMLLKLDEVGTSVWLAIDGTKKVTDLVRHVCDQYDVGEKVAKKDILGLLRNLKANEAIEYI
jgi:hypothetical protein